jgi:hypothetical protein
VTNVTDIFVARPDVLLIRQSKSLRDAITTWAKQNSLWQDCCFTTWIEHYDSPPDPGIPAACLLCIGPSLWQVVEGRASRKLFLQFDKIVRRAGFWWDRMDNSTLVFLATDENTSAAYRKLAEWNWMSSLIAPDFALMHESIFEYFNELGVSGLVKLSARDFEIYLDSLFQGHGYRTNLGPGTNDGGVDLRLYSSDITGEVLTLVQAKRYTPRRAIRLDAVQALTAAVDYEPAQMGFFVTTSRFLPSAQRFAERKAPHIQLLQGEDVIQLTLAAAREVADSRARLIQFDNITKLMKRAANAKLEGQIFHATTGYGIIDNRFAICVKSSAGAALMAPIPCKVLKDDGYGQAGYHVADTSNPALHKLKIGDMFVAKLWNRRIGDSPCLWGNRNLYTVWNGKPCHFDFCD